MQPFLQWWFKADDIHQLFIQQVGNPEGSPILFLHGGPGSGCRDACVSLFDLDRFHIILMDQRGAGRSSPHGCLENNTTKHLIEDIEGLRTSLQINSWALVGGSWGATLAIAYAQAYPEHVDRMVLRSVFLGSEPELMRAFIEIPKKFYPEVFEAFIAPLSIEERNSTLYSYYQLILSSDQQTASIASHIWHDYERILSVIPPQQQTIDDFKRLSESGWNSNYSDRVLPNTPRLEAHYFSHQCFLDDEQLLSDVHHIAAIPACIIQSRYDLLCPPYISHKLVQNWQNCDLIYVDHAGHSQSDPSVSSAMYSAINH